jgi:DME family drug/metabolite transporter
LARDVSEENNGHLAHAWQVDLFLLAQRKFFLKTQLRGYVIVLSGTVIWALTGIVIKILLTQYALAPLTMAFWRVLIVAAFMFVALAVADARGVRVARRDVGWLLLYGIVGIGVHQIVWISSVQYNGAAVATVIIYTAPALVALVAARFLGERLTRVKLLALALTLTGCALVARVYDARHIELNALGLAMGLGSACTFATYSLVGRVVTQRYSAWVALFYAFFFGALFLLPLSVAFGQVVPPHFALDGWGWLIFLALVPTLGGFGAYTLGLSYLPASIASLLAAFEPVTTAILAYIIFGEMLEPPQLVGAGMILASVILLRPQN